MRYPNTRPPAFTLTTGPVDAYPEVLRAMGATVLYDYDPAFQAHYEAIARKAQEAMGTGTPPVILQGEPVLGLEAAAASLVAKDDVGPQPRLGRLWKGIRLLGRAVCQAPGRD